MLHRVIILTLEKHSLFKKNKDPKIYNGTYNNYLEKMIILF